jgi:hypothetical protein
MAFSLSPFVQVTETNLSFNVPNLPSSITGAVVTSDTGPAFEITSIGLDSELTSTFGNPGSNNFKDWYNAFNFLQYANSLRVVRPIDQAKTTKNVGTALAGGDGDPSALTALTTYQGIETDDIYNQTQAELKIPSLAVSSFVKPLMEFTETGGTYTFTHRTKLRGFQLTQLATTGADSGVLVANSVNTLQVVDSSPDFRLLLLDETALGGWNLDGDLTLGSAEGSSFAIAETVTGSSSGATGVIATGGINADVLTLTDVTGAFLPTEPVTGSVSGAGTVDGEELELNSAGWTLTGDGPYVFNGTIETIRLQFYNKWVNSSQNIAIGVCSNAASWNQAVSTDIASTFKSFFEFEPVWADNEFAVILFTVSGATFTQIPGEARVVSYLATGTDAFGRKNFAEEVYLSNNYVYCAVDTDSEEDVNTSNSTIPQLHNSTYETIYPRVGATDELKATFPASTTSPLNGSYDGAGYSQADIEEAFDLWADSETTDVQILMAHATSLNKASNITTGRKDCIAVVSPFDETIMVGKTSSVATTNLTNDYGTVDADSDPLFTVHDTYSAFYGNMKYQFDKFNDTNRWLSPIGDVCGLYAETDLNNDPWFAPAGINRGVMRNVIKLAFNPTKASRDNLYVNSINPIITIPGEGTGIVFGQKTATSVASAFDRVNVRRLLITIEKAVATGLRPFVFEFNDTTNRDRVKGVLNPFLAGIKARRGLFDFLVVCDETNNTAQIIDLNQMVVDIYLKPTKVAEFIQVNVIVTSTGTEFSEVV